MADVGKDLTNLATLFQRASQGANIRGSFNSITRALGRVQQPALKQLCFQLLTAAASDDTEWFLVLNTCITNLSSQDATTRAYALRALPKVPARVWKDNFDAANTGITECLSHPEAVVRSAAIHAVHSILLLDTDFLRALSRNESPVEPAELWSLIVEALTDMEDEVAVAAFSAVGDLLEFMTGDIPLWHRDHAPDCRTSFKFVLRDSYQTVRTRLLSNVTELIHRTNAVIPELRSKCLPVISTAVLASAVPSLLNVTPSSSGKLVGLNAAPLEEKVFPESYINEPFAKVDAFIQSTLRPLFTSLHVPLVYEACVQSIKLITHRPVINDENRRALHEAVNALLMTMERSESASYFSALEKTVTSIIHLLDPISQIEVIPQLLQFVESLKTLSDRSLSKFLIAQCIMTLSIRTAERHLQTIHEFQQARAVGATGKLPPRPMTELQLFLRVDLVKGVWENSASSNVYREELAGALCTVMSQIGDHHHKQGSEYSTAWLQIALDLCTDCVTCVTWDTNGRNFCADAFLTLFAKVAATQRSDPVGLPRDNPSARVQHLLATLITSFDKISSPAIETRVIWLLSEHLLFDWDKGASGEKFIALLKRRLLRIDVRERQKKVLAQARQTGVLAAAPGSAINSSGDPAHSAVIMQCILRYGLRLPLHMASLNNALQSLLTVVSTEDCVGDSVQDSALRISRRLAIFYETCASTSSSSTNTQNFNEVMDNDFPPPWELYQPSSATAIIDQAFSRIGTRVGEVIYGPRRLGFLLPRTLPPVHEQEFRPSVSQPCTLTGPSDPIALRVHHITNPKRLRVSLHVSIVNLTEMNLENVRVSLAIEGKISFTEAQSSASRVFKVLKANEKVTWEVALDVTGFAHQRVHPGIYFESGGRSGSAASARKSRTTVYCQPYAIHVNDFLLPDPMTLPRFMQTWGALSASLHASAVLRQQNGALSHLVRALCEKPFSLVTARPYGNDMFFQVAFTSHSWFKEPLFFTATGSFDFARQQWMCRFEFRSSSEAVLGVLDEHFTEWFADLCGPSVISDSDDHGHHIDNSAFNDVSADFAMPPAVIGANQDALFDRWNTVRKEIGLTGDGAVNFSTVAGETPLPEELCAQFIIKEQSEQESTAARLKDEAAAVASTLRAKATQGGQKASDSLARLSSSAGGRFKGLKRKT